jgi:hypothetical protein
VHYSLTKKEFPPQAIDSHSLQPGGVMAMHLNDIDRDKIRKQGRWSSDTFFMCIQKKYQHFLPACQHTCQKALAD